MRKDDRDDLVAYLETCLAARRRSGMNPGEQRCLSRWIECLKSATIVELPPDEQQHILGSTPGVPRRLFESGDGGEKGPPKKGVTVTLLIEVVKEGK